jgi:serine/threonine protein phosphatase PrpC
MPAPPRIIATRLESAGTRGEDRLLIDHREDHDIIAVADGAGGTGAGALAAEFLCARILAARTTTTPTAWADTLREADAALYATHSGGEATAVVLAISATSISGASVGDSGAWLVTASNIVDLTHAQHRKPLLGSGRSVPVAFAIPRAAGRLLVATDGLLAYAPPHDIAALVRDGDVEHAASALLQRVRLRSGALADDVAIVLYDLDDAAAPPSLPPRP